MYLNLGSIAELGNNWVLLVTITCCRVSNMLQRMPRIDNDGDTVMTLDLGDDAPDVPALDVQNYAVPERFRGYKPDRRSYRIHVMKLLYSGTWRFAFAFTMALPWFVSLITTALLAAHQRRKAYRGIWKVRTPQLCHPSLQSPSLCR